MIKQRMEQMKKILLSSFILSNSILASFAGNGQYPTDGEPIEHPLLYCILLVIFFGFLKLYMYFQEKYKNKKNLIDNIATVIFLLCLLLPIVIAIGRNLF